MLDKTVLLEMVKSIGFDTIETRNNDSLDFKEVAIWRIIKALEDAYQTGYQTGYSTAMEILEKNLFNE